MYRALGALVESFEASSEKGRFTALDTPRSNGVVDWALKRGRDEPPGSRACPGKGPVRKR